MVPIAITFLVVNCFKLLLATRDVLEVERPRLAIEAGHGPLDGNTIDVNYGENVTLECVVHPIHHTVQWQVNDRLLRLSNHVATLDFSNALNRELGVYRCRSPSADLQRTLRVIKKRYWYREEDDPSDYQHRSVAVETFSHWSHDWTLPPNGPPANEVLLNPHSEKERQDLEEAHPDGRTQRIHNVGIGIGGVAVAALILGLMCVLCRDARRRAPVIDNPTEFSERTQVNEVNLPEAVRSSPTAGRATAEVAPSVPEGLLPPSYEEAILGAGPSAPKLNENCGKM